MKRSGLVVKIIILSLILGITSCSNVLTTQIKDEKEGRQSRNASEFLNFRISGAEYGTVEPAGEITCKIGGSTEIVFTEFDEYQFVKWEVINSATGKTVQDVIKISEPTKPETQLTVLKIADNILLRPVCVLRPQVISKLPAFKPNGVYKDSVIIITFDKKISESSIYYTSGEVSNLAYDTLLRNQDGKIYGYISNDYVYFKNLTISSQDDENLLAYFMEPVIENDTILKLTPKAESPIDLGSKTLLDIDVFVSPDFADENGYSVGGEGIQWRYRINPYTDDEPPVFESFAAATSLKKLQSGFEGELFVPGTSFNPLNHSQSTIYYSAKGSDNSGSLNYIKVETKRIQTASGETVKENPVVQILTDVTKGSFDIPNADGVIQVTFTLYDMSGNASEDSPVYLIAKDTTVNVDDCRIFNNHNAAFDSGFTAASLKEAAKTIFWGGIKADQWQKDNKTDAKDLKYTFKWNYKDGSETIIECTKESNFDGQNWFVTLDDFDSTKEISIALDVEDALGNKATVKSAIPANPAYFTYQKLSDGGEYTFVDAASGKEKTIPYPAHYRIFFSNDAETTAQKNQKIGLLYYSYEGNDELQTQAFLNVQYNQKDLTASYSCDQYSDIYVDDISKCRFYYQNSYYKDDVNGNIPAAILERVFAKVKDDIASGAALKELDSYNPELRNACLKMIKENQTETAEKLITEFYLWNYVNNYSQGQNSSNLLFSNLSDFVISESNTLNPPEVEAIHVTKGAANSGTNNASIKYSTTASYGIVYGFLWGTSENNITNYETSEQFKISSGISKLYYKTVCVDSKSKETKTSEVYEYDLSNCAFDTQAPAIAGLKVTDKSFNYANFTASEYYPVITCEICYDDYEVTAGKAEYTLYVVPADYPEQTFDQISEDKIKVAPSLTGKFVPPLTSEDKTFVWNNIEGLGTAERYFYVLYLKDRAGNYSYSPIKVSKKLLNNVPQVTFAKKDASETELTLTIEKEPGCNNYQFEYYLFNGNDSQFDFSVHCIDAVSAAMNQATVKVTVPSNSYYFAFAKAMNQNGILHPEYTVPVYFYTGDTEAADCDLKDLIDGMNGAQVYCDRPALVMTYWSSENYEFSVEKWEAFGVQCNPMFITAKNSVTGKFEDTLKYYTVNYDQIPKGKFFVIVAHYADGTSLMSKSIKTN